MRILLASSEAVPFSKTGGLADVAAALSKALAERGHDVSLFIPHYPRIQARRRCPSLARSDVRVSVPLGEKKVEGRLLWARLPDSRARVFLVEQPEYFDRDDLYNERGRDYSDNCERFVFFSRAVMEFARHLVLLPDIVHANDWQTGLLPALLDVEYRNLPGFRSTASVMTLHNMAFQGVFWHWDMQLTGISWKYFNWKQMESYGQLNLLKSGIAFADKLSTVSPTYASEICTPEAGCGLDGILQMREPDLVGILNGIDTDVWNPQTDVLIEQNYSATTFSTGKAQCKAALQKQLSLPERPDVPLFGMVSRMTDQKGFDLLTALAGELMQRDLQLVFLGTGDPSYEAQLSNLAAAHPDKVSATIGFDESLAHQIEAGADLYLMPSLYEPCGLNQMYSLAYGTIPIVRRVGGLADSVVDATPQSIAAGAATGFVFPDYDASQLLATIDRALEAFQNRSLWEQVVRTAMGQDFSWNQSAASYETLYRSALQSRTH